MNRRLALCLTIASFAGLLSWLVVPGPRPGPAAHPRPTPDPAAHTKLAHPLDPLSKDEFKAAVAVLRAEGKLPKRALFPVLVLNEPPKEEVLDFKPGDPMRRPMRREAFAVVMDRARNKTYEAVIDLKARKALSWKEMPGVHPAVMPGEFEEAAKIVRQDAGWQEAMRKRDIRDFDEVYLEAWAPGPLSLPGARGARLLRVISFYHGDAVHPYARPVEGVIATVNVKSGKVVDLVDGDVVPVPKDAGDFFDPKAVGTLRPPGKPLVVRQPKGPGFEVRGHEVRWERWRFRFALHPREGLVLYTVGYEDGGKVRPVLYRASLAEMIVPYGDPADTWAWRSPFDEGEYGLGRLASPLRRGQEVPDHAKLFDATFADDTGAPYLWPQAVALYEEDGGILWSHTDLGKRRTETRRARRLVLTSTSVLGNYDYGLNWIFNQDGSLEVRVDMMGVLLARAVRAESCPRCRQQPGADGKLLPRGEDRHGTFVANNVVAPYHQHLFCFRLDLDVDGPRNRVEELNGVSLPMGKDNPRGNAFTFEHTLLRTEKEARRDLNLATARRWRVLNPDRRTPLGHFPAYMLEPGANTVPHAAPDSQFRKRAGFVEHHLWVTRQNEGELYPAGPYPNQHPGGEGLPKWSGDEKIDNQDVVLWYTCGVTHLPRVEEWPVMPTEHVGFRLVPDGFFTRNPALDVPPANGRD